ncbi:MAG: ComEC/Rec2 family competence protein [Alphaproteobacteria bacterium]|nr:ComEC/Rec2 family competence protein [Alphaproteobacteria bacterium SS10]
MYSGRTLFRYGHSLWKWLKPGLLTNTNDIAGHWYLSVPILMIVGIAAYFALPIELPVWAGSTLGIATLICITAIGQPDEASWLVKLRLSLVGLLIVIAGFSVIQLRTHSVAAPMLQLIGPEEVGPVTVRAELISAEPRDGRHRLVLEITEFQGSARDLAELEGIKRIRISMPGSYTVPEVGSGLEIRAILRAPPGPSYPGGYAFRRDLFFQQIGAVGFAIGDPTILVEAPSGLGWHEQVASLRFSITTEIFDVLPGETGAVAAALVTGQRGGIGEETLQNIRDAGISHLLAISGLHLGVVAAWLFFCIRAPLAAIPPIVLRLPLKKISTLAALLGAGVYLVIAGMPTPTIRAFLMVAMGIGAIWLDRDPFSLRLVGLAAIIIILLRPELVMGPSFQMSFAAVVGLIATYQALKRRGLFSPTGADRRLRTRVSRFLLGLMLTTIIASAATAPFAIWHFQHAATFGLIGNLVGVPLASMWIIPLGLVSLIAMPFGVADWPLLAMGSGIDLMLVMAADIAALPYAALDTPALTPWLFGVMAIGVIMCLARLLPWVWLAAGVITLTIGFGAWEPHPVLLARSDGDLIGVHVNQAGEGRYLLLSRTRRDRFTADQWRRHLAGPEVQAWRDSEDMDGFQCDGDGCLVAQGLSVALTPGGLAEDCGRAEVILLPFHSHRSSCAASTVIDRWDLRDSGGLAIFLDEKTGRYSIENIAEKLGSRPWSGHGLQPQ